MVLILAVKIHLKETPTRSYPLRWLAKQTNRSNYYPWVQSLFAKATLSLTVFCCQFSRRTDESHRLDPIKGSDTLFVRFYHGLGFILSSNHQHTVIVAKRRKEKKEKKAVTRLWQRRQGNGESLSNTDASSVASTRKGSTMQ